MRPRLLLLACLVAAGLAPAATANPYCEDVAGVPHTGFGPVCTVRCALQHEPRVDPHGTPVVHPGTPTCMWED